MAGVLIAYTATLFGQSALAWAPVNALCGGMLVFDAYRRKAWPFFGLNVVWTAVALLRMAVMAVG